MRHIHAETTDTVCNIRLKILTVNHQESDLQFIAAEGNGPIDIFTELIAHCAIMIGIGEACQGIPIIFIAVYNNIGGFGIISIGMDIPDHATLGIRFSLGGPCFRSDPLLCFAAAIIL